jgi:hypothetical protein
MGNWQQRDGAPVGAVGGNITPEIEVYRAKVALTGVVDVANGPSSPAVVLRALAALVAEDAVERGAHDAVAEFVADLETLAAKVEQSRK